jgi:uncharacterized membrane protein
MVQALFVALATSLRLLKHVAAGSFQFVNFPGVFAIMGGLRFGAKAGAFVGVMSFVVSDLVLGQAGPWTVCTALSMGLVGALSPLVKRVDGDSSILSLGVFSYLLILVYDILSSMGLMVFTAPIGAAFFSAVIGLFLPSTVLLYPIGLVTEIVTVLLIVLIYPRVKKSWEEVRF